jgi:pyruvate-formate lyase
MDAGMAADWSQRLQAFMQELRAAWGLDVHWPAATVALHAVSLFWFMQLLTVEVGAQREQDLKQEAKTLFA